jgi:hypothetical protein
MDMGTDKLEGILGISDFILWKVISPSTRSGLPSLRNDVMPLVAIATPAIYV